jgi:hypothetical protein
MEPMHLILRFDVSSHPSHLHYHHQPFYLSLETTSGIYALRLSHLFKRYQRGSALGRFGLQIVDAWIWLICKLAWNTDQNVNATWIGTF